ncbi:hypothetical protein A7981_07765 [Methylovorus sp. MM2]|uniref:tetratricopeptide repeat protein n=1 Tax=Methylovorus sp. MM2 TaxID=1848038 RepID=UPI0007DEB408|nr:tetratricopeptide repeat protein [Methylovorus sp. MM2]OAM51394.1 hypothetical protein A7981_07765 [Methylovorus sp. MM2]
MKIAKWIYPLIILGLTSLVYGKFLWNPIVFDDIYFFLTPEATLEKFTSSFNLLSVRWLAYATLAFPLKFFGTDLINFRLPALLLHAATGVALFLTLKEVYALPTFSLAKNNSKQTLSLLALLSACIFVTHPIAAYAAGYLIQRTIVLATLFSLLSLLTYLRYLSTKSTWLLFCSLCMYLLAVLSKEHAIMLPAFILVISMMLDKNLFKQKLIISFFIMCGIIGLYVVLQKAGLIGHVYEPDASPMLIAEGTTYSHPLLLSIIGQCCLYFKYLALLVFPNPAWLSIDMRETFPTNIWSLQLVGMIGFFSYGFIAFKLVFKRNSYSLLGLALLFPWILFFTELSVVRIQESFVLYRCYLWMPGIFIAIPLLLTKINIKSLYALLIFIVLCFSGLTINRLTTFSHPLLLWDDARILLGDNLNYPGADRIFYNCGIEFKNLYQYQDAITNLKVAIQIRPNYSPYLTALGNTYALSMDYYNAIYSYQQAIKVDPNQARTYQLLGLAYSKTNQNELAKDSYLKACTLGRKDVCESSGNTP